MRHTLTLVVLSLILSVGLAPVFAVENPRMERREEIKETRMENKEERRELQKVIKTTNMQERKDDRMERKELRVTNGAERKEMITENAAARKALDAERKKAIEEAKADGITPGELEAINKSYAEKLKAMNLENKEERVELRVTNGAERKELRVSITQQRKAVVQANQAARASLREQIQTNWSNFFGSFFGPKPTTTPVPTSTE